MSCSWSEELRRVLTPRLALALAASAALHGLLVGGFGAPGEFAPGQARSALSVALLPEAAAQEARPAAQPAGKPAPGGMRYYRARELDARPRIMTRVAPEYPPLARGSGKVVIRLFIDEAGTVERVGIVRADPPGMFEASAQRAFLAARFTPGMKAGKAVRAQVVLELSYPDPRR